MQQKKEGCGTEENTGESKIYPHPFRLLSPTPAMPMNREVEEKSESGEGRNANLKTERVKLFSGHYLATLTDWSYLRTMENRRKEQQHYESHC